MADRSLPKIETGEENNRQQNMQQQQKIKPPGEDVCTKARDVRERER